MSNSNSSQQVNGSNLSPSITDEARHGYRIDAIEETNIKFRCIYCTLIIQDPIQLTECGHRACRECLQARVTTTIDEGIKCPLEDCGLTTKKKQLLADKAFKKELDILRVRCVYRTEIGCIWTGLLKDYQKHLDETHIHYNCPACVRAFPSKLALDEHLRICPEIFRECQLGVACTADMIPKEEFENHLRGPKHQETVMKFLLREYHISDPSDQSQQQEQQQQQQNHVNKELEQNISEKVSDLNNKIETLKVENTKITGSFHNLYQYHINITQEFNHFQSSINERRPIKQNIPSFQEKLQKEVEQLHDRCSDSQRIYTDGTLTWRIDNVSEKMADAQSERQTSIFSPIFYSSTCGYQMRARLFLFGDGNARRTHISIFFLLMKGQYDSILKWPFHYKVTFCLLDQTGNNRHIIDSFYPDVKSNSFQQPREATNIASGIPKFFALPMLLQDDNAYVRDNIMFIRIVIALNETPKNLLPFMLTLNPALPTYVQETLVSQEAAKQQANAATSS